uniref:ZP domain-containing protein n=1 Tax=Anisakis simplex TaxID=6269 RepID=A0A0M3JPA3_ANISI
LRPRLIVVDACVQYSPVSLFLISSSNLFDFRSRGSGTVDQCEGGRSSPEIDIQLTYQTPGILGEDGRSYGISRDSVCSGR